MDDSDMDVGFAFEPDNDWESDFARSAAEALAPMPLDLGNNRGIFMEKAEVDLGGIGERLRPDDDSLHIGADSDRLGEDLAKLKEHEADLKLRALLDKAERAIRAGRIDAAWAYVEEALKIAPTNVPALLLGARCQHISAAFETALDLLAVARQHA